MLNRVVLVGRLTKDVELRYTTSGIAVARFVLAVNRQFAKNGEKEADFVSCIAWRKTAENLSNYTKKGSLVGVDGRITTGSYEGNDGKKVYTTDIVADSIQFLDSRKNNEQQQQPPAASEQQYSSLYTPPPQRQSFTGQPVSDWGNNQPTGGFKYVDPNDDLPF